MGLKAPLRLTGSLRTRPSLRAEMDACAGRSGPMSGPAEGAMAAGEGLACGVNDGAIHLGVHLLDEAEGGVGHEQGEDDPEVQVRPEGEGEQAGDLNLRARVVKTCEL